MTSRVSGYGRVLSVDPPSSPFASITPLDVFGFDDVGANLVGELPRILVEDALREGLDVTGLAVVLGTSMIFVSAAVVSGSIRLVMSPREGHASEPVDDSPDVLSQAEFFQKLTDGAHQGDDLPVTLTVRQVQKIAAIAGAVKDGHTAYGDALAHAIGQMTPRFIATVDGEWRADARVSMASVGGAEPCAEQS